MFGLFPKDPEVVRVLDRLVERLKNLEEWKPAGGGDICHREFNITVRKTKLSEPKHMWILLRYWRHRGFIKNSIKKVNRQHQVDKLSFIFDVTDGKYPYQEYDRYLSTEKQAWIDENSKEGEYLYRNQWLYFADEALAMAFKLRFS